MSGKSGVFPFPLPLDARGTWVSTWGKHCHLPRVEPALRALFKGTHTLVSCRALVEFLGPEDMLAKVCDSRSVVESLGIPPATGALNKTKGLLGFVKSRNLEISGRYQVRTLTDESRDAPTIYDVLPEGMTAMDDADPQKPLNISPMVSKPGSERLMGSLGYAVNMVHLSENQLKIHVLGRGLQETLFFGLFGYVEVFYTTNNNLRAQKSIRTMAVF